MSTTLKNYGSLIFAGICFGTTGTAQALGPSGTSPLVVGATRLLIGGALLWVINYFWSGEGGKLQALDLWIGAIGVALYQLSFFSAVRSTGVAVGTLTAIGSAPALTGILAYLINRERPTFHWVRATVVTTIGIVFLTSAKGFTHFNGVGVLEALGAGASYSLFAVASKRAISGGVNFIEVMYKVFGLGAILLTPIFLFEKSHFIFTAPGFLMVLWLGAIPTAIAYTAYAYGLIHVRVATASTLILAEPATATLLAAIVLGEKLNFYSWLGVLVVTSGLLYLSSE
jgi:DME family drug/metabolite transporter